MKRILWVDDVRPKPYIEDAIVYQAFSVHEAINTIQSLEDAGGPFDILSLDHDAGFYASQGGDYIKILDWLEATGRNNYEIHLHTMNPVGADNMRRICIKNNWRIRWQYL